LQRAELFSTMTDHFIGCFIGWGVALLVGAYAGNKFLEKGQKHGTRMTYLESLATSAGIVLLGVGLRQLAWAGVNLFHLKLNSRA